MVRVKICGITNIDDALAAVEAGADALGFVFAESKRKVDTGTVLDILQKLPPLVTTVGVFANQDVDGVYRIWKQTGLHFAQLHDTGLSAEPYKPLTGSGANIRIVTQKPSEHGVFGPAKDLYSPDGGFGFHRIIRALRVKSADDIRQAADDRSVRACAALLLDAHVEGMAGGTGQTFDWDLAVDAQSLGKPIILAGGLTPENVVEAVRKVRPYAVDVSSGVEASQGRKDHARIKEFIHNAKSST